MGPPGNQRWLMSAGQPLFDAGGKPDRYIGIVIDITERKRAEEALQKINTLKDEFIGMVSHELKTPLTVIIGALSVAESEELGLKERIDLVRDAEASAEALIAMVDNLLELSRHQSKRLTLQVKQTRIEPILRSVAAKMQNNSPIHHIMIDLPPDLPSTLIDPIRIERVLSNLVENAIKYSPKGGQVSLSGGISDRHIVISVRDEGIGISAEDQHRLFDSFQRLNIQDKYNIEGVGLGLRVCRILVEAHGGRIWVESDPGKGSTFFFSLPVVS
jgi:two-component system, OmpR family, phosphate regulon sensor histidine kinase PhoR